MWTWLSLAGIQVTAGLVQIPARGSGLSTLAKPRHPCWSQRPSQSPLLAEILLGNSSWLVSAGEREARWLPACLVPGCPPYKRKVAAALPSGPAPPSPPEQKYQKLPYRFLSRLGDFLEHHGSMPSSRPSPGTQLGLGTWAPHGSLNCSPARPDSHGAGCEECLTLRSRDAQGLS